MLTFDKMLDDLMRLDFSTRELLLEILHKRQIEERRKQIAADYRKAKTDFAKGKSETLSASEIMKRLGRNN